MLIDYIILLILALLPIYYRYSLWLYSLESVEYDMNSFFDLLKSTEWKNVLFNFWFIIEVFILFLSAILILDPPFEVIYYNLFYYLLLLENIFVIWKIFRKNFLKPTFSKINIFMILLLIFFFCTNLLTIYYINIFWILYPYLILILLFSPILCVIIFYIIF